MLIIKYISMFQKKIIPPLQLYLSKSNLIRINSMLILTKANCNYLKRV